LQQCQWTLAELEKEDAPKKSTSPKAFEKNIKAEVKAVSL